MNPDVTQTASEQSAQMWSWDNPRPRPVEMVVPEWVKSKAHDEIANSINLISEWLIEVSTASIVYFGSIEMACSMATVDALEWAIRIANGGE